MNEPKTKKENHTNKTNEQNRLEEKQKASLQKIENKTTNVSFFFEAIHRQICVAS